MAITCCCEEVLSLGLETDLNELRPSTRLSNEEFLNDFDRELKMTGGRLVVALREARRFGYELFEHLCERFSDELDIFELRVQLLELVNAEVCVCWLEENIREFETWHCLVNVIQRSDSSDGAVEQAQLLRLVLDMADFLVSMDEGNYQRHLCLCADEYDPDTFGNSAGTDRSTFGLGGHQSVPIIDLNRG